MEDISAATLQDLWRRRSERESGARYTDSAQPVHLSFIDMVIWNSQAPPAQRLLEIRRHNNYFVTSVNQSFGGFFHVPIQAADRRRVRNCGVNDLQCCRRGL
jgi:hypothetical protein